MCARCSKSLASKEKIFLHNDNVLCRTCISLMRSRKCFACGKVISSSNKGLHALGKEWHIACFICSVGIVLSLLYAQSALQNPITVTPIWKWEFENEEHPIRGLYITFFEKFLFKIPFSHKRFQMGQKMYFHQLYKL